MRRTPLKSTSNLKQTVSLTSAAHLTAKKGIRRIGQGGKDYTQWKLGTAIPYLLQTQGELCAECHQNLWTDVAHISSRGSDPKNKKSLTNVRGLCRSCHSKEHQ